MSIHLSPELERRIAEAAEAAGTTPDDLLEKRLSEMFPAAQIGGEDGAGSLADFLGDYIGILHSSEHVPGGANLSENTGERFTDLLVEQRANGRL